MDQDERLPDVWNSRDLPVLIAAARLLSDSGLVTSQEIASTAGFDEKATVNALINLSHRHLRTKDASSFDGRDLVVNAILPPGLEAVRQWPTPEAAADRMLAAVNALIEQAPKGSPKSSKLLAVRDTLASAGRDVLVSVAASAISGRIPV